YNINEKIFTYLAEKKLEAQISRAAILSGANVINQAQLSLGVVAPIASKVYVSALLLGLAIGGGLIILIRIINPYIYDKETVESLTQKPIIGVVRKYPGKIEKNNTEILSLVKPKSVFAESIRSVRTNLSFLASEKASKVICITSEISGEGKSFMAVNLASTLALIDKKIIIIAADLRKSKLHKTFQINNKIGLSTYLTNQSTIEDVVFKTEYKGLFLIPSGPQAPNPSELLHSSRMSDLITKLSEIYDFVIIDTAPVGLVSDSIPLIRKADINLFVIRSGVSKFTAANIPDRLAREYSFNNIAIVLNAFSDDPLYSSYYSTNYSNGGYGGYYYYSDYSGYNYDSGYFDDEDPRWWNVMKHFKNWKKNKS
ncbi:MAG TPA: CpsD/CapB family tyrosine-protein kinase, partial [Emticicia sp.]